MTPALHRATAAILVPLLIASPGCLSSSFHVAGDELSRLARTPPEQRWQAVRVTQRMIDSDRPPSNAAPLPVGGPVVFVPNVFWYGGRSWNTPPTWGPTPAAVRVGTTSGGTSSGSSGRTGSSSGGHSSGGGRGPDAAVVVVVVLAAAVIVFVLAGTEGSRYDGWVGVPPDETVFLDNPDGTVSSLPLSALTPELADSAHGATIYEGDEGRYLRLARAPLNRVGFTLQSGLTTAMVPHTGAGESGYGFGFGGRAFLGGYPAPQVGLGISSDVVAGTDGSLVAMVGGEAQVMPLLWGGAYLGAGWASLNADDRSVRAGGWYARGGAQLELPLSTRFAASLRAGVARLDFGLLTGALVMPELSLGLSVY